MGRKDRERFEQMGKVHRDGGLVDVKDIPKRMHERMQNVGERALQAMDTGNQVKVLRDSLHQGRLSPGKLRKTLEAKAPKEMRKGADKLRRKNKPVAVDALLEEYRNDRAFKELAEEVGLDEAYFVTLAEKVTDEYYRAGQWQKTVQASRLKRLVRLVLSTNRENSNEEGV